MVAVLLVAVVKVTTVLEDDNDKVACFLEDVDVTVSSTSDAFFIMAITPNSGQLSHWTCRG